MATAPSAVLYVDDDRPNLDLLRRWFDDEFEGPLLLAGSAAQALELLEAGRVAVAVVIADQRMPGMTGIELLEQVARRWPLITRVLLTAYSDRELLLAAIQRSQVQDYVLKPWEGADSKLRLKTALDLHSQRAAQQGALLERDALLGELAERTGFLPLVGQEAAGGAGSATSGIVGLEGGLAALAAALDRIARSEATVMIRGESGTGKELVARELHRRSARAGRPFVRVNCAALGEGVLESELFGHEVGAFTGAVKTRIGRFEQAHTGTLFLDEIGDVPAHVQVKLLRVLQERELERVGGTRTIAVDLRIIAATHRKLEEAVREGRFREDLFHRLQVVPLRVPPLRERPADIRPLVRHFLGQFARELGKSLTVGEDALLLLERYDWPGNVRELRNVIERAAVLADAEALLTGDDMRLDFIGCADGSQGASAPPGSIFEEIAAGEAERIREALRQVGGSKAGAARLLGIPRTTLNDRIERLGIR